jgi:hypothetical protein
MRQCSSTKEIAMDASLIELADCRRHDFLADAARERLAKEARPDRPLAAPSPESLLHAMRTLRDSVAGALAPCAINPFARGSVMRDQTMMPAAH